MYLFSGELEGEHITRLHVRGSVHGGGGLHSPGFYNSVSAPGYLYKVILLC